LNKKILLLINNAGSHFNPKVFKETSDREDNEEEIVAESSRSTQNRRKKVKKLMKKKPAIKLSNIKLVYLPPNTTAHL